MQIKNCIFYSFLIFNLLITLPAYTQINDQINNLLNSNKISLNNQEEITKDLTIHDYLITFTDSGRYDMVSYLLIKGANPNYCNDLGFTALMIASMKGYTEIAKLLIKRGANVNVRNIRGESALLWAIIGRQVAALKLLIENKSEINIEDENKITPLFYSLGYSTYDLTSYANEDYIKNTIIDTSTTITKKLIETLLSTGIDINQVNELDCTPLLFATFQNDTSLVKILCSLGADPNKTTIEGITPLMFATQEGFYNVARLLIKDGARVNYKPKDGNTALFAAARANKDSIAILLLDNQANVNDQNNIKLTPLHYTAGYGYPFLTEILINSGANVNIEDIRGNTPLISSVYSGAEMATKILLDAGAEVDKPDLLGNTPLMIASQYNDTSLIKSLYYFGADLGKRNNRNANALSFALQNNAVNAFELLLNLGAKVDSSSTRKSLYQQSVEIGNNEISAILISRNLKTRLKPNIGSINFHTGFTTSINKLMLDIGTGINEPITKTMLNIGFKYQPRSRSVLEYRDNSFYQLWQKSYTLYISLQHLMLNRNYSIGSIGFAPGLSNEFNWNFYRGISEGTPVSWNLVPSLGFYYQKKLFTAIGKWEIVKYNTHSNEKNRFSLQLFISIFPKNRVINKKIEWLE